MMMASQTLVAKSAAKSVATKAIPSSGLLFAGKGLGLGLGIGLWGPVIIGAIGAVAVYGLVKSRSAENEQTDEEINIDGASI